VLNKLRKAQRRLGADLVSLFRKPSPDNICGIAGLVDTPTHATNDVSYSVVSRTCVSNLSLHHELGHNMGLRHDSFVDPTPGVGYNHGYVNTLAACRVRTVMGYNNQCSPNFCTRINAFSTPAFTVKVGSTNCQIGSASSADNTRRLIENRKIISKYRRERDTSAGIPMADVR
jgi:hypothetical protein